MRRSCCRSRIRIGAQSGAAASLRSWPSRRRRLRRGRPCSTGTRACPGAPPAPSREAAAAGSRGRSMRCRSGWGLPGEGRARRAPGPRPGGPGTWPPRRAPGGARASARADLPASPRRCHPPARRRLSRRRRPADLWAASRTSTTWRPCAAGTPPGPLAPWPQGSQSRPCTRRPARRRPRGRAAPAQRLLQEVPPAGRRARRCRAPLARAATPAPRGSPAAADPRTEAFPS
mmetsp:Transcript_96578/g.288297  ORF Transcript_96578/g.288297 Transcript_96578/m.288297 type:complete len:231 (-) Transcript_96578:1920-2612(-)